MTAGSTLTIHQFRVFDAVIRSGSLTQASLALDIPQPSVSRVVARLEREVGTALLNRANTGVTLTAAGERFHRNAVQAMHYHDMAIEEARASKGLLIGDVRIAAPDSVAGILFAPLVRDFKDAHRDVRLRTIASQSTEIPGMLASGAIDVGIVADTHALPPGPREPLFREHLYLVGPSSSPLVGKDEIPLADVGAVPLILNAMPGGFRALIDKGFAELGIAPKVDIEIDANNALLDLLGQGAGYAILPFSLVAAARSRIPLAASRIVRPSLVRTLYILTAPNKPIRAVAREAIRRIRMIVLKKSSKALWRPVNVAEDI